MKSVNRYHVRSLVCLSLGLLLLLPTGAAAADAWTYADTQPATNPQPWACVQADPGAQLKVHEHWNWHCTWPPANTTAWGAAFIGFHKQFITDFEVWRLGLGGDRVEVWDYGPGAIIPGDDETTSTHYTHCPEFDGSFDPGTFRPAGSVCGGCANLPNSLNVNNIGSFATLGDAGAELQATGWHGSFHIQAGSTGGDCNEVSSTRTAIRDPIFFMGHKKVDDIARTWQRAKAADIVVVLDRSGSMNDDCFVTNDCAGPNDPGDESCRLNAAKNAALMLADLLDDAGVDGDQHMIGLVSYSSAAGAEVGLTSAATVITNNNVNDTAYEIAIANIEACGGTSIGAGIQEALTMLGTGSNPHQAMVILTDGMENVAPYIDDVAGAVGPDIQVCAVAVGPGGNEIALRNLTETHAGNYIAQEDIDSTALTMEKFFVDTFAQIFDEVINEDPELTLPAGEVASLPIQMEVLPDAPRLMIASAHKRVPVAGLPPDLCDLQLLITTPTGNLVDMTDPQVELGDGAAWDFSRVRLPYRGERSGRWNARLVRQQRLFVHGFATDAYQDMMRGVQLVREEIHRLCPEGADQVLYYEDGNLSGNSAYARALAFELEVGLLGEVVQPTEPTEFRDRLLAQSWDLIVFARQLDPSPQIYDGRLAAVLCNPGQKALVTDLFPGFAAPNPIYECLGMGVEPSGYEVIMGDGRLVGDPIPLQNPGYQLDYLSFFIGQPNQPLLPQGWTEFEQACIVGSGSPCGDQNYFYTTHTAGVGRVEPVNLRPRILVGQKILATFTNSELNRPIGGWDMVEAKVELRRPNGGQPVTETYPLYDDGTNGDANIGNYTFSHLIPAVATESGPHMLRGIFELSKDGQTVRREAQYSIIVEEEPDRDQCLNVICNERVEVASGWDVKMVACLGNMCVEDEAYQITVRDSRGWLCVLNEAGDFVPVEQFEFVSEPVRSGEPTCFYDETRLFLCVPQGAEPGDGSQVFWEFLPLNNPESARQCETPYVVVEPVETAVEELGPRPANFQLYPASPNPFNPRTEIAFEIPGSGEGHHTLLRIYDVKGVLVRTLVDETRTSGRHSVFWNGRDEGGRLAAAGVYFYALEAAGERITRKMVLLK